MSTAVATPTASPRRSRAASGGPARTTPADLDILLTRIAALEASLIQRIDTAITALTPDPAPAPTRPAPQIHRRQPGQSQSQPRTPAAPARRQQQQKTYGPPRSGRGMYAWAKEQDCLKAVDQIGAAWGFPERIVNWTQEQVSEAYTELTASHQEAPSDSQYGY